MKSPFPGMDPFIEGCGLWGDFHDALIQEVKNYLGDRVPERYLVRTGERSYIVLTSEDGREKHSFIPDVNITSGRQNPIAAEAVAVAEPATDGEPYSLRAFIEEEYRESFIEILDSENDEAWVTCIEILSPSNQKPRSTGWDLYQRKRQALLLGGTANLVEIDLLRGGDCMPMVDPWRDSPYRMLVARKSSAPICKVWPAHFLYPLPAIPVPLLKPDADVTLDLQPLIDAIYARSKYWRSIDYARPISPPLGEDAVNWLKDELKRGSATA